MLINELAQWGAIAFMAVFVFGLTRQLGRFLVPPAEQAAMELGPDLGSVFPLSLIDRSEQERLTQLMDDRGTDWAAVLIVSDDCPGCESLLESLADPRAGVRPPVAALSRRSGEDHRAKLDRVADVVRVDRDGLRDESLRTTPFVLLVDRRFKVVHKQLAWSLWDAVDEWTSLTGSAAASDSTASTSNGHADSASTLVIEQRGS